MTRYLLSSAALIAALLVCAPKAESRPKAGKNACNPSYFPLRAGVTWAYDFVPPEGAVTDDSGLKVEAPGKLSLSVQDVREEKGEVSVTVIEQYRNVVQSLVYRCNKKGLSVPVQSLLFSGEPGGARGTTLENVTLEGELFPPRSLKKGASLYVQAKADLKYPESKQDAKHSPGRLEMERQLNVGETTVVETVLGNLKATEVEILISGRVFLEENEGKEQNMPSVRSLLWFAPKVGLIKVNNRFGHGWRLTSMTADETSSN